MAECKLSLEVPPWTAAVFQAVSAAVESGWRPADADQLVEDFGALVGNQIKVIAE